MDYFRNMGFRKTFMISQPSKLHVSPKTMVTCLVIGDPHFKVSEMIASQEMANAIVKIAQERNPDFIVCLGDTLDRHETIHTDPLTIATKWLRQLTELAPLYLLIGNHDRVNNSDFLSEKHPFVALKWWHNLTLVDQVYITTIQDLAFFFVPYVPPGRFFEALATHPEWSHDGYREVPWSAGFSHQEFYGIKMAPNIFSGKGDHWPLDWPLLINGHIHDRDVPQANIISVGTPRQHDFDESFDKSLSLFTFEKGSHREERIFLPLPKKIILRLSVKEFLTYELPYPLLDHLKIEIHGTRAEIIASRKLDKVKNFRKRGIKVVTKDIEAGKKQEKKECLPSEKSFRDRLSIRAKEDPDVEKIFQRLFRQNKKVLIKKKKKTI